MFLGIFSKYAFDNGRVFSFGFVEIRRREIGDSLYYDDAYMIKSMQNVERFTV